MKQNWKKLLSLLLVLTMLVGMMPAVFAAEEPEQVEEILTDEVAEPVVSAEPETPEVPEEPAVPEEPEEPETCEEAEPAEAVEEPAEAAALPCGFPGMGEGYELSEEELAAKLAIAGLPEALADMVPGVDYVEGELLFLTGSADYAQQVADAYDAELLYCDELFGRIRLRGATVQQALECAADPDVPLPAVEPNWLAQSTQLFGEPVQPGDYEVQGERMDWEDWGLTDPLVRDPSSTGYQFHHDILGDYAAWGVSTGGNRPYSQRVWAALLSTNATQSDMYDLIRDTMDGGGAGVGVAPEGYVSGYIFDGSIGTLCQRLNTLSYDFSIVVLDAAYSMPVLADDHGYASNILYFSVKTLTDRGVLVIAPMGDDGSNRKCWPAAFSNYNTASLSDGVIAVAATNADGTRAGFSNYGDWCDISAPGVSLNGNTSITGTAYAAALVGGAAILYADVYGTTDGFKAAMKKAATKGGVGAGIVNTANLFGQAPGAFTFNYGANVTEWNGDVLSISEDGFLSPYYKYSTVDDSGWSFVYTLNGKNPAMLNGHVKNPAYMELCDDSEYLYLSGFGLEQGKTYTLKVLPVNGLGIPGKIQSLEFRLVPDSSDVSVSIVNFSSSKTIAAGGSYIFQAEVQSAAGYAVSQKVSWEIRQYDTDGYTTKELGAKIDKSGKLTTKPGVEGVVRVRANYTTANGTVSSSWVTLTLKTSVKKVKTMRFDVKGITIDKGSGGVTVMSPTVTLLAADGTPLAASGVGVRWSSSNENVVYLNGYDFVNESISLHALDRGTATITATAMDGSGKSASFKVTVVQHATGVSIYYKQYGASLFPVLVPGGSLQLSAMVQPNANNQEVEWEIYDYGAFTSDQLKINPKTGVLKLDKKAGISAFSAYVWVKATAKDTAFGVCSSTYQVMVRPRATAVDVWEDYSWPLPFDGSIKWVKGKVNKQVSTITLFSTDLPGSTSVTENELLLGAAYWDTNGNLCSLIDASSSKPNVVEVSTYSGLKLTAKAPGTSTVTVKSRDGLKKQSFTVKVITPISGIQLSSAGPNKTNVLSYGKSLKLKATTFSTYGKPADTKLKWEAFVYQHGGADVTAQVGSDLSIKNGVLTLKKAAVAWNLSYITVKVTPAAYYNTDYASDLVDTFTVYVINPIKSMTLEDPHKNQPKTVDLTNADMLSSNPTCAGYEWLYLNEGGLTAYNNGDNIQQLLTVKSSNPKLVSARLEKMTPGVFRVAVASPDPLNMPEKKTTVKITVTANDGSGKSVSFNVTVQNVGTGMG